MRTRARNRAIAFAVIATIAAASPALGAAPAHAVPGGVAQSAETARVEAYLDRIRDEPGRLTEFVSELPKGGDLHTHLSGAVSTAYLIATAIADRLCVDAAYTASEPPCKAGQRPVADARTDRRFHDRITRAWSMKGFSGQGGESGHDHFFATFGKFSRATWHRGAMLAQVASEAAAEHISYLEPLVSHQGGAIAALASKIPWTDDLPAMERAITRSPDFGRIVKDAVSDTEGDLARMREALGCATAHPGPGCRVTVREDHQVGRIAPPSVVFANLLLGFVLSEHDPDVVGVNLVQPEDDPTAIAEYGRQMRMVGYLRRAHPAGHVTLHAGELTPKFAGPGALRSHVRDAVMVAGAERIGHGVDIAGEDDSAGTLRTMAARHTLVEINLTSNCQILEVCAPRHPFTLYRANHVPVTLSTDDEGVEHTDLTHEYVRAVRAFHLSYADLRTLARASLEHAFVQGRSLWRAPDDHRLAGACTWGEIDAGRPGAACAALLRSSAKARLQWRQEVAFHHFEQRYGDAAATGTAA